MRRNVKRFCLVVLLTTACAAPMRAGVRDDLLQKAFNYVFTGTIDPHDTPEIVDLTACAVVVPDPRYPRFIRYYFGRIRPDNSRISKDYAGRQTLYKLEIESVHGEHTSVSLVVPILGKGNNNRHVVSR